MLLVVIHCIYMYTCTCTSVHSMGGQLCLRHVTATCMYMYMYMYANILCGTCYWLLLSQQNSVHCLWWLSVLAIPYMTFCMCVHVHVNPCGGDSLCGTCISRLVMENFQNSNPPALHGFGDACIQCTHTCTCTCISNSLNILIRFFNLLRLSTCTCTVFTIM